MLLVLYIYFLNFYILQFVSHTGAIIIYHYYALLCTGQLLLEIFSVKELRALKTRLGVVQGH